MTNIIIGHYDEQDWYGVVTVDGRVLDPKASQRVRNHSPNGFAWGYEGSGPAQLALAILLAVGLSREQALLHYQSFKRQFLAPLDRDSFRLELDVVEWGRHD